MSEYEGESSLGHLMFGHADLGDARRTRRLVKTFDRLRRHPGGSLPAKLSSPADLKALYRLCACRLVTHAVIVAAMRQYTLRRLAEHSGDVLIVHDATELDYSSLNKLAESLGQVAKGFGRGYICHNVLAVDAKTGEVIGLIDQILHCRDEVPDDETLPEHRNRETRESLLWVHGTAHLPADRKLVDVADQGAGTFEFFEHEMRSGRRFVIRDGKVRRAYAGHEPTGELHDLKTLARNQPELGRFTMDVAAQPGRKARKQAEFTVRSGAVLVRSPHAKYGFHGNDPLPLHVVHVMEVQPPPGEDAIEWLLLTNEPVRSYNDAWRVVGWYERRWIVEEFHKGLKTGCGIEQLQFTAVERLTPAIGLLSALALTLLNLRDVSRRPDAETRLATTVFPSEYVDALSAWRFGAPRPKLTVKEFALALARMGGHQNRKHDGMPGWITLWRGWTQLQAALIGYMAAQPRLKKSG